MDVKNKLKTVETILPAGEITEIIKLEDGRYKVVQMVAEVSKEVVSETRDFDNDFILIEAEDLSMDDIFMKYNPINTEETKVKALISEAINKKVNNFYRPKCDPSFTASGEAICFVSGKKPAVGKCYEWWHRVAKNYKPERNSRLGTRLQYGAFIGVLIKKLVEEGKTVKWAWNAVCRDSRELGHYWDSENAKQDFEPTGSRMICGFYDLANTFKILADDGDKSGFWLASGTYDINVPIADLFYDSSKNGRIDNNDDGVGWIVLD